jgi:hypothetical protein
MYAGRQGAMGSAQLDHGICDDLRQARRKTATGNLARVVSPACELGKVCTDDKGVVPDDVQAGGAFVVVRGRESRPHGEGRQFKWFAW